MIGGWEDVDILLYGGGALDGRDFGGRDLRIIFHDDGFGGGFDDSGNCMIGGWGV